MDKEVSIVRVDHRPYRVIAQENWGLTKEQMKGKHVHHRIKRCDGGTNDPSNLYVCSEWFHDNVWHADEGGFAGCASEGARRAHQERDVDGKSLLGKRNAKRLHSKRNKDGKSLIGVNLNEKIHALKDEDGKSLRGKKAAARNFHDQIDENGKDSKSVQRAAEMNAQRWMCTVTGYVSNPGYLSRYQKRHGIPTTNRVRIG